jgi:hypothetical protein
LSKIGPYEVYLRICTPWGKKSNLYTTHMDSNLDYYLQAVVVKGQLGLSSESVVSVCSNDTAIVAKTALNLNSPPRFKVRTISI